MRNERGLSILELMVALVVVGVLAATATPGMVRHVNYSRRPEAYLGLATISRMQDAHYVMYGRYASTIDELGFQMDQGSLANANAWVGHRYTFSVTPLNSGRNYVATAVGDLDGDEFQDILFTQK